MYVKECHLLFIKLKLVLDNKWLKQLNLSHDLFSFLYYFVNLISHVNVARVFFFVTRL